MIIYLNKTIGSRIKKKMQSQSVYPQFEKCNNSVFRSYYMINIIVRYVSFNNILKKMTH